jgi:methanogenic corrinoid protein MtbC1
MKPKLRVIVGGAPINQEFAEAGPMAMAAPLLLRAWQLLRAFLVHVDKPLA